MEVKINKEIRDYTEKIYFGLTLRQLIFSILACGIAVLIYFLLRDKFTIGTLSWLCILGAFPFAALGFITYNGMNAEEFIKIFQEVVDLTEEIENLCKIKKIDNF